MESSAGQISAEQLRALISHCIYDPIDMPVALEKLNALIAPLIQAARVDAAAEMRERCADSCDGAQRDRFAIHDAASWNKWASELADDIRTLSLPPAEESFLREKIELMRVRTLAWQQNPALLMPTYESIMASKSK